MFEAGFRRGQGSVQFGDGRHRDLPDGESRRGV